MTQNLPVALPSRLDLAAVPTVAEAIRARLGADLVLDAADVTHLGGLGVQLLLGAALSWREAGQRLRIAPRSAAFDAALETFGIALSDLETGDTGCP